MCPLPGTAIRFLVAGTTGAVILDIHLTGELTLERDVTVDDIPQSDVPDALNNPAPCGYGNATSYWFTMNWPAPVGPLAVHSAPSNRIDLVPLTIRLCHLQKVQGPSVETLGPFVFSECFQ